MYINKHPPRRLCRENLNRRLPLLLEPATFNSVFPLPGTADSPRSPKSCPPIAQPWNGRYWSIMSQTDAMFCFGQFTDSRGCRLVLMSVRQGSKNESCEAQTLPRHANSPNDFLLTKRSSPGRPWRTRNRYVACATNFATLSPHWQGQRVTVLSWHAH